MQDCLKVWVLTVRGSPTQYFTARKRSLGQGNIFTRVCQSSCPQGGVCLWIPGVFASESRGVCRHTSLDIPPGHTPLPGHRPLLDTDLRHTDPRHTHRPQTHTHTHTLDTHTLNTHTHTWSTSGHYASYWNAFLFAIISRNPYLTEKKW